MMAMKNNVALSEAELLRCLALLGPPPILSSEDRKDFEEIFRLVAQCVGPRNMVEVIYLWHFVCASWFIKRYGRHAAVSIERHAQETFKFHAERAKLRQQRTLDREKKEVEKLVQTPADVAHLVPVGEQLQAMVPETDAILEGTSERDHNRALQQGIVLQEQYNALIISQTAIRSIAPAARTVSGRAGPNGQRGYRENP